MKPSDHPFFSLEHVLQRTLHRIEPPQPFVHGLGRKIRVMPTRTLTNKAGNGLALLLIVLISALCVGLAGFLFARLLRHKPYSPST